MKVMTRTRLVFWLVVFGLLGGFCMAELSPGIYGLKCEYKANPLGIDVVKPRLSWKIVSQQRGVRQSAYQIRASRNADDLAAGEKLLWDSGKVLSEKSIHVVYDGPGLVSGQRVWWQVRAWDEKASGSAWSEPAWWEMGLLKVSDWKAQWIEPNLKEDSVEGGCKISTCLCYVFRALSVRT